MRIPDVIDADRLRDGWPMTSVEFGVWCLCRPESGPGGLLRRLRVAWKVFTGKYDALRWDAQ